LSSRTGMTFSQPGSGSIQRVASRLFGSSIRKNYGRRRLGGGAVVGQD